MLIDKMPALSKF